jgi:hypothetical protein
LLMFLSFGILHTLALASSIRNWLFTLANCWTDATFLNLSQPWCTDQRRCKYQSSYSGSISYIGQRPYRLRQSRLDKNQREVACRPKVNSPPRHGTGCGREASNQR